MSEQAQPYPVESPSSVIPSHEAPAPSVVSLKTETGGPTARVLLGVERNQSATPELFPFRAWP